MFVSWIDSIDKYWHLNFRRSFHRDLHPLLLFAQCFGIMPISNVNFSSSSSNAKMKLLSVNMIYCLTVHAFIVVMMLTLIYYFISEQTFDYGKIVAVVFFFNCFVIALNFIYISHKMPQLIKSWQKMETEFEDAQHDGSGKRISWKILSVFMTVAFCEHFLSKAEDYEGATFCFDHYPSKFEAFSRTIIPMFFEVIPYNHLTGVYVILTCFFSTVLWNFCDVFLITFYFITYTTLRKFNQKIVRMRLKHVDEQFWLGARLNYVSIHKQVKAANRILSGLVLFSLLNDFYFVCNQVLGALKWVYEVALNTVTEPLNIFYFQAIGVRTAKLLLLVLASVSFMSHADSLLERIFSVSGIKSHHKNY